MCYKTHAVFFFPSSRNFAFIMIAHNLHHILYIYKARGLMKYLNTFQGDHLHILVFLIGQCKNI